MPCHPCFIIGLRILRAYVISVVFPVAENILKHRQLHLLDLLTGLVSNDPCSAHLPHEPYPLVTTFTRRHGSLLGRSKHIAVAPFRVAGTSPIDLCAQSLRQPGPRTRGYARIMTRSPSVFQTSVVGWCRRIG